MTDNLSAGLRERKKIKTKKLIRQQALKLFMENGYNETTIEQIAESADISPSTIFRYFQTKDDILFEDQFDDTFILSFQAQPHEISLIQTLQNALLDSFSEITPEQLAFEQQRHQLVSTTPELQNRNMNEWLRNIDLLSDLISQRISSQDKKTGGRTLAGALVGVLISATTISENDNDDPLESMITCLDRFENSFSLLIKSQPEERKSI